MSVAYRDGPKRVIDAVVSVACLVLLSPLIAIVAAAVRLVLGSPVLFMQTRLGRWNVPFTIYKFRSMREGPGSDAQRLGRFGRVLRASALDELPQLVNVARGDMSLVGPRPLLPEYLPRYTERQATRHEVRPGLTGLAQVTGRNRTTWSDRLECDARYVENVRLGVDLVIILKTLARLARPSSASAEGHATMEVFGG